MVYFSLYTIIGILMTPLFLSYWLLSFLIVVMQYELIIHSSLSLSIQLLLCIDNYYQFIVDMIAVVLVL